MVHRARGLTKAKGRGMGVLLLAVIGLTTLLAASTPGAAEDGRIDSEVLRRSLAAVLPGATPSGVREAAEALAKDPHSPSATALLMPLLAKASAAPDGKIADAIEAPGNSLAADLSAGKSLNGWVSDLTKGSPAARKLARFLPGLAVEAEGGSGGATLKAGISSGLMLSSVAMNTDPQSRSVTLTLDVGTQAPSNRQVEVHDVVRLKFSYKDNHDYLLALTPVPGRETVLDFMDKIFPGVQDLKVEPAAGALPAALQSFKRTIAPNADRFANFESYTFGTGVDIIYKTPDPTGAAGSRFGEASMKVSFSNMERMTAGKQSGEGIQYLEASVALAGKTGSVGGYNGGATLTLAHTTDPEAQTQDPHLHQIAEAVRQGRPAQEALKTFPNPIDSRVLIGKIMAQIVRSPEGKNPGSGGISSVGGTGAGQLGGVMLFYDPALLGSGTPPGELIELFRDLSREQAQGKRNFSVRRGAAQESFHTVSLAAWLRSPERTLGGLTRVRGYVLKQNDLVLIGQVEAGRPPIDPDVLTVALNAVYREGRVPAISLDPDPRNPTGLHRPRLIGIPKRYQESEFVRALLDADYDMKRLCLDDLHSTAPGFKSQYQIVQRSRQHLDWNRFWLSPLQAGAGEILEEGPVVLFDSRVRVQTERMQQVDRYLAPTGQTSPIAEEAAQHLTSHYAEIERELDSFYQLHGVFDVAKLCALLSYRKVKSPLLDAMAERTIQSASPLQRYRGTLLDSYRGIGPVVVADTQIALVGGAVTLAGIRPGSFAHSAALKPLELGDATIPRDHVAVLAGDEVLALRMQAAAQAFAEERFDSVVTQAGAALAEAPDLQLARFLRALANCSRGDYRGALPDLDRLVPAVPQLLLLRALARMGVGDDIGARRDVAAAGKSDPVFDNWIMAAWARVSTLDLDGAQRILDRLKVADLGAQADVAHSLHEAIAALRRMPSAEARREIHALSALPMALRVALSHAQSAMGANDGEKALPALLHVQRLIAASDERPAVRAYHSRERVLFMLAITSSSGLPADKARAIPYADQLIALRPDWATGYLLKAHCLMEQSDQALRAGAKAQIDRAFRKPPPAEPLFTEWLRVMGNAEGVRRGFYSLGCMQSLTHGDDPSPYLNELARIPGIDGRIAAFLAKDRWLYHAIHSGAAPPKSLGEAAAPRVRALGREALAAPPSAALPSVLLRGLLVSFYAGLEETAGHREATPRIIRAYLRGLPGTEPFGDQGGLVALYRAHTMGLLVEMLIGRIRKEPEVVRLIAATAQDASQIEPLHRRIQEEVRAAREESARNDRPFEAALIAYLLETAALDLEIQALEGPLHRNMPSPVLRELQQQADRLRSERVKRLDGIDGHFDEWLSLAKSDTEQSALTIILARQSHNLSLEEPVYLRTQRRMQESLLALKMRIRVKRLRQALASKPQER